MSLVIHAPNVHHGGGRTLLLALLNAMRDQGCLALLDERLVLDEPLPAQVHVLRFGPSLRGRFAAEIALARRTRQGDQVLCFGNLPPLLPVKARVTVLVQNRYLVAPIDLTEMGVRARTRIRMERLWLRYGLRRAELMVQTPSMARDAFEYLGVCASVMPFAPIPAGIAVAPAQAPAHDFVYVASGEPHKNHRRLIEGWIELARRGQFPSLCLTLSPERNAPLLRWIDEQCRKYALRIENVGQLDYADTQALYASSGALIYPSLVESFGLPLLEAQSAGLPIVAAERDYVRDVVNPAESFDPVSPVSLARAVLRHLGTPDPVVSPLSAASFVARLLISDEPGIKSSHERTAQDL